MLKIKNMHHEGFKVAVVSTLYYKNTKLERAIDRLFVEVDKAYRDGANILVLSDRGVDENHMPIPSLLAVSACTAASGTDKEEYISCHYSGIRRTKRSASFCNTARLWRKCC